MRGTCLYMLKLEKHKELNIHPHLHYPECNKILCLPCLPDEYLKKLEKYEIDTIYFLMQEKCWECSANDKQEGAR